MTPDGSSEGAVRSGKLVRDGIPAIIQASGEKPILRVLAGTELFNALIAKLDEKRAELRAADESARAEELADIFEVVRALVTLMGLDMPALEKIAAAKRLPQLPSRGALPSNTSVCTDQFAATTGGG